MFHSISAHLRKHVKLILALLILSLVASFSLLSNVFAFQVSKDFAVKFTRPEFSESISGDKLIAVRTALSRWDKPIEDNAFTITSVNQKSNFSIATVAASDLTIRSAKKECEESKFLCSDVFNILLGNVNNTWTAALEYEGNRITPILSRISDNELSPEAKKVLFIDKYKLSPLAFLGPINANAQSYTNYKFPWSNGVSMAIQCAVDSNGLCTGTAWHEEGRSIDFAPYGSSESTREKNILSAAPATVAYVCNGTSNESAYDLTTTGYSESVRYVHIDYATIPSGFGTGTVVNQGDYLGRMVMGAVAWDGCGVQTGTHVHIRFPSQDFVIDGITFSATNSHYSQNAISSNFYCAELPPTTGTWNFTSKSCYLGGAKTVPGDIVVDNSSTLNINSDGNIDVNFAINKLLVKNGSKVLIKSGGKIN